MRVLSKSKGNKSAKSLFSASTAVLQPLEKRLLYSTVTAWNFDNNPVDAGTTFNLTPTPSTGTGTASSVGFSAGPTVLLGAKQTSGTFTLTVNDSTGSYTTSPTIGFGATAAQVQTALQSLHPATTGAFTVTFSSTFETFSVTETGDPSAVLSGNGASLHTPANFAVQQSSPFETPAATGPDSSATIALDNPDSTGSTGNMWKIRGTNGWTSLAPIGSQGAQFLTSTLNYASITAQFDIEATTQGEANVQLEYTTDGSTWNPVPAADLTGFSTTATVETGTGSNTVNDGYWHLSSTTYNDALTANLSAVTPAVEQDPNFGIRIVNASTGADDLAEAGTALNNTSGNWSLDNVIISGVSQIPAAPVITQNPVSVTANGGTSVSFSAAATGIPSPSVQWQSSSNIITPSYSNIPGATSTTYTIPSVSSSADYRAVFSNTLGSNASSAALLTVYSVPTVTVQPVNETVSVPNLVTFSTTAFGPTIPTVQWQVSTGAAFQNVSFSTGTATYNSTTGVATYTYQPTEGDTGDQFQAIITNGAQTATAGPATLTVLGTPISEWQFTSAQVSTTPIPYPQPNPTAGTGSILPLGMDQDYNFGQESQPEDDIVKSSALLDSAFSEPTFRIRGGSGQGTTGSAGSPEGWSEFAPNGTQGVQFNLPTTGFQNVVLHFDWYSTTSGSKSALIQYTTDGSTWSNYSNTALVATSDDFYGDNASGTPTGVTLNFQGISAVNNNSNFAVRMVSVYQPTDYGTVGGTDSDNALPAIFDDNLLITDGMGNVIPHGQYATADPTQPALSQQEIVIGGTGDSGNFQLSIGSFTTPVINYNTSYGNAGITSAEATLIQNAFAGYTTATGNAVTVTSLDSLTRNFLIQFSNAPGGVITANYSGLSGGTSNASLGSVAVTTIYAGTVVPFTEAGSGNWRYGNIVASGDSESGAPGILTDPQSQTVSLPLGGGSTPVTLTASAYSETGMTSVQWMESTDGGNSFQPVPNGGTPTTSGTNLSNPSLDTYASTYTFAVTSTSQNGIEFEAEFNNNSVSATTTAATILVVIPSIPTFTLPGEPGATYVPPSNPGATPVAATVSGEPQSTSVISGTTALFTGEITGLPLSTNVSTTNGAEWYVSNNSGGTWTPVPSGEITTTVVNLSTGYQNSTSVLSVPTTLSLNGYEYEMIDINAAGSVTSSPVTLTVLHPESPLVQWTFGGTSGAGIVTAPDNTPSADTTSGTSVLYNTAYNSSAGVGLVSVGMTDPSTGSVPADDVTATAGTADGSFTLNTWRIRGGTSPSTPGSPANGWDAQSADDSQGAEIDINTTGVQDVYMSFQWATTAQGVRDLQEQYNTNVNDPNGWTNINAPLVAPNAGDYYGSTNATTPPTGALLDLTGIAGADNNPNFGVRLVATWDPYFGNQYSDPAGIPGGSFYATDPRGQYASATATNGIQPLNGTSGNWRFGDIVVSAVNLLPAWLSASPTAATWNPFNETLNITGPATIIADPAASGDAPNITVTGASGVLDIDPISGRNISIGGLTLSGGASAAMTSTSDILIVGQGGAFTLNLGTRFDLGDNFLDLQNANASQGAATLANVFGLVQEGYNNGAWNGNGLFSTTAQTTPLGAIGFISNNGIYNSGNTFDQMIPGANDVLVRYTYVGDANLDGKVDGSDYSDIDAAYLAQSTATWFNGNFNYDTAIDGSDYTLIDNAFNSQGAQLAAQIASPAGKHLTGTEYAVPTSEIAAITDPSDLLKKKGVSWASTLIDSVVTT